jgi:oligopeptide/dipeptide ABC transporter ATP-binding protein
MGKTILEVVNLKKHFVQRSGLFSTLRGQERIIPAVDDVSFYLKEHETIGLVGESGSGKTTVGRTILGLTPATSGRIFFDGRDITALPARDFRPLRKEMQMIFQDLDAALNPKMRIQAILKEAISVHQDINGAQLDRKVGELLEQVNLKESKLTNFPHELSGGEKRRVGIARALAVGGLSYLFISHDLRIVELVSHKVGVMYLGRIVEMGLTNRIAEAARHPYTHILWSSLVDKESREAPGASSGGKSADWGVFDFERPYLGCRFAPRCPVYQERGRPEKCTDPSTEPHLREIGEAHRVACHFPL